MRIDYTSLAFGIANERGYTPNWFTSLGQGKEHKINNSDDINEIIKGMLHSSVSLDKVSTILGKDRKLIRGNIEDSPILLGSVFSKVYINGKLIVDGKFILLIIKDLSKSHNGRLKLQYSQNTKYEDEKESFSNKDFYELAKKQLELNENSCWFISQINIEEQDKLKFNAVIVDKDHKSEYNRELWNNLEQEQLGISLDSNIKEGKNIIFYGIAGAGKSTKIKNEYCDNPIYMERVVFHQDYTYADFIGQILPENNDGHISYPFIAGPFTRILTKAVNNPNDNYYLIIEEINRGNAPAIFGEIFQLLDRENGESEYGINNADIANAVYEDPEHIIKIPKNLFILATMNTADQNVFTLDTAFKRRWEMVNIKSEVSKCSYADKKIANSDISWEKFVKTINPLIIECGNGNIGSEDKRLGAYFAREAELESSESFSEKVLMYLWCDAFKYNHEMLFKTDYKTLEELIDGFKSNGFEVFINGLFT